MVEFELYGLTPHQQKLADALWSIEEWDDVVCFIDQLPERDQKDAESILEMMRMAVVEQCYDGIQEFTEALEVIKKVK